MLLQQFSDRIPHDVWILLEWNAKALKKAKDKIRPKDIVILNGDDQLLLQEMAGVVCHTVTFGYHLKSTLTISGREEDVTTGKIFYSFALQRPILTCSMEVLEPCELKWAAPADVSIQSVMATVAFFLIAKVAFFS